MIEFQGAVQATASAAAAVNLVLRGRWRDCDTQMLFAGAEPNTLPSTLHEVRVTQLDSGSAEPCRFRIESSEMQLSLQARSLQVHRAVGAALFQAVPSVPVPLSLRAGWALLLSALNLPGVGRLLLRRRGSA